MIHIHATLVRSSDGFARTFDQYFYVPETCTVNDLLNHATKAFFPRSDQQRLDTDKFRIELTIP